MSDVEIIIGDCREVLRSLPSESVNCVVTSPPYWGLRNYGVDSQIGLETSPDAYVAEMVAVFHEVHRVLRRDGTLWLNLGDSYSGSGKGGNPVPGKQATNAGYESLGTAYATGETARTAAVTNVGRRVCAEQGIAPKQLIGVPWRAALALQADGWWLRQDIIWAKPNPMPESVLDRCTRSHEYLFLLSKSAKYHFDAAAIAETADYAKSGIKSAKARELKGKTKDQPNPAFRAIPETRNRRDVWFITPKPFKGAHFATFPPELVEPCILAGCPEGGVVLDPFGGAGTTGMVAERLNRNAILIELNPAYAEMALERINAVEKAA